ncbi:Sec-independent protein translocase subunit TatA [Actinospica robiniae]|uniref:Sec-independent protein translocase subunit TatA n=1 Tax=Actinospica robiniae TaxID=304901 RepID=UPI00040E2CCA|nr:Sec-independent protein translocase subunit TatA [Actinospica robiniae]
MFLRAFEGWHILIILGLAVVLFGARKLPDSARSIGQSLRIFKSEMKAAGQDGEADPAAPAPILSSAREGGQADHTQEPSSRPNPNTSRE